MSEITWRWDRGPNSTTHAFPDMNGNVSFCGRTFDGRDIADVITRNYPIEKLRLYPPGVCDECVTAVCYPMHAKLNALAGTNEVVGDFLTWLNQEGYRICTWVERHERFSPFHRGVEGWIAAYFGIDAAELDREKRAMLDVVRANPGVWHETSPGPSGSPTPSTPPSSPTSS